MSAPTKDELEAMRLEVLTLREIAAKAVTAATAAELTWRMAEGRAREAAKLQKIAERIAQNPPPPMIEVRIGPSGVGRAWSQRVELPASFEERSLTTLGGQLTTERVAVMGEFNDRVALTTPESRYVATATDFEKIKAASPELRALLDAGALVTRDFSLDERIAHEKRARNQIGPLVPHKNETWGAPLDVFEYRMAM